MKPATEQHDGLVAQKIPALDDDVVQRTGTATK
jgi:hypothetical protein